MNKLSFQDVKNKKLLLYEYIRGSQAYGTSTPESDEDHGGIYIAPEKALMGLGFDYQEEILDEKGDTCWWEIGRFLQLALKSNPTVLEALFIPDDKVIYEHPLITELKKYRDQFLTKRCFKPLGGYMVSQIEKARGQNKKIHWDINQMTRKTPSSMPVAISFEVSGDATPGLDCEAINTLYLFPASQTFASKNIRSYFDGISDGPETLKIVLSPQNGCPRADSVEIVILDQTAPCDTLYIFDTVWLSAETYNLVVTSDNPRSEDPDKIIEQIVAGAKDANEIHVEPDRRKAIEHVLAEAGSDDVVIIAGKGHETTQEIKGVKHPFDDREIVRCFGGEA